MLTNAAVKAAGAQPRAYKIADERGLFLFVTTAGTKSWRMKFRYQGREQLLTFGTWPQISLADARAQRDATREQLRNQINPAAARRRSRASAGIPVVGNNFETIARAWHAQRSGRWSTVHAGDVLASLERDVFPAIGATPIADIDELAVLELLQGVEQRGCIETARRLRQRIAAVFALAKRKKLIADNPAADLADELAPRPPAQHHAAIVDQDEARALLEAIDGAAAAPIVRFASRFLALTAVRLDALRGARWEEFEDLEGAAPLWIVPAARMKLAKTKKAEARFAHAVPLSPAAVDVLRAARAIQHGVNPRSTGGSPHVGGLVFPGRAKNRPIGEAAIGAVIARAGYQGRHVPHGWRASFSTIMNDRYPDDRAAIDQALGHVAKDKVEAAYNRSEQLARRRRLFNAWADVLCGGAAADAV